MLLPSKSDWLFLKDKNLWSIFFLSFSSGLPFLLILATLGVWLTESGVSKTQIGLFAWVTIPYTLKFLIAPIIDQVRLPKLTCLIGQRRSWILVSQLALMMSLIALGKTDPADNVFLTAWCALLVGICSASQDIVIEAYRIEILKADQVGIGASVSVIGYRIGMLCSGAGALYIAAYFGWAITYNVMAGFVLIGIITTLLSQEPKQLLAHDNPRIDGSWSFRLIKAPILSFFTHREWQVIIPLILCYKVADTILNVMSMPFLVEIGFTKIEIANVAKSFGIVAMILGGCFGGLLLLRQSIRQNLLTCTILQLVASGFFIWQFYVGRNIFALFLTMGFENFTCGISQVVLVAYLSQLCSQPHTAMHYAILTSFASFARVNFSSLGGWLADQLSWPQFYFCVGLTCIPTVILLICCNKHFENANLETSVRNASLG